MAPQHDAAFEPQKQMLADGVDALEHPAIDDARDAGRLAARIRALRLDRSPTSGRMRAAARWIASPSGT